MATLTIRKISDKVWKHTPSDGLTYIVSRLYIKSSGDKVRVVEFNGAIRSEYDYSDVIVYNVGGGAETFTSVQDLFERLEQLGYIGFFNEGGATPFNPSDYDLNEFTNSDADRFARLSDIPIQSINAGTNITINNTDPKNPIINATGGLIDAPSNGLTYGRKDGAWSALGSNSGGDIVYNIGIASLSSYGGWGVSTGGWATPPREICSITSVTAFSSWYNGTTITDGRLGKLLIPSGYKLKEIKYYASESGTPVSQTLRILAFNITSHLITDLQTIAHLNYTSQTGLYESDLTLDVTTELTRKYITFALNVGNSGNIFQQGIISIILTKA